MAVVVTSGTLVTHNDSTSASVSFTNAINDWLLAVFYFQTQVSGSNEMTLAPTNAGFTLVTNHVNSDTRIAVYKRQATAANEAPAFTFSASTTLSTFAVVVAGSGGIGTGTTNTAASATVHQGPAVTAPTTRLALSFFDLKATANDTLPATATADAGSTVVTFGSRQSNINLPGHRFYNVTRSTTGPAATMSAGSSCGWTAVSVPITPQNVRPLAPTLTTYTGGATYDRTTTGAATHTHNDPEGDAQASADHQYRVIGAGSWTTQTLSGTGLTFTLPANLAAGNYERQVKTSDAGGAGPFSASSFFTLADPTTAPTITAPAAAATITASPGAVTWTSAAQDAYRVRVLRASDSVVLYDSGVVVSAALTANATYPEQGAMTVQVAVRANSLFSSYTSRSVTVTFPSPATPTLTVATTDEAALGFAHAVTLTLVHPSPTGGQPAVSSTDLFVRPVGGVGYKLVTLQPATLSFVWRAPAAIAYEFQAVTLGVNGGVASTAWSASVTPPIKGVLLHDPTDEAASLLSLRFNDDGGTDAWRVEQYQIIYQGREFPVVEYGDATSRVLSVALVHCRGTEGARLLALVRRRRVLCYRDKRGRKVFGSIDATELTDTAYGQTTSLTVTATDWPAEP